MTRTRKIVLIVGGVVLLGVLGVVVVLALLVSALRESQPDVASNSVLVLEVSGSLPDYSSEDPLVSRLFGGSTESLESLVWQLKKAKADRRVKAVLLDVKMV